MPTRRSEPKVRQLRQVPDPYRKDAELRDLREFTAQLPEEFLYCREMGHNWQPFAAARYVDGGFQRTLRCHRCGCERVQDISPRGLIISSRYRHPDGYLHKGLGPIAGEGRGVLRLASLRRLVRPTVVNPEGERPA